MSITLTGSAGCNFNITKVDTANAVGTIAGITYLSETAIRSVTFNDASLIAVYSGQVGTTGTTIDLYANADATDATYTMRLANTVSGIVLATVLTIIIHNKDTASDTITLDVGASNSWLTASNKVTIDAGSAVQLTYASGKTVDATHRNIKLTASAVNTDCEIYILGTA